jgi:hypothetical protein
MGRRGDRGDAGRNGASIFQTYCCVAKKGLAQETLKELLTRCGGFSRPFMLLDSCMAVISRPAYAALLTSWWNG